MACLPFAKCAILKNFSDFCWACDNCRTLSDKIPRPSEAQLILFVKAWLATPMLFVAAMVTTLGEVPARSAFSRSCNGSNRP